jgi:hypothetical protein
MEVFPIYNVDGRSRQAFIPITNARQDIRSIDGWSEYKIIHGVGGTAGLQKKMEEKMYDIGEMSLFGLCLLW